jgi:hypothetical protein
MPAVEMKRQPGFIPVACLVQGAEALNPRLDAEAHLTLWSRSWADSGCVGERGRNWSGACRMFNNTDVWQVTNLQRAHLKLFHVL